MQSRLPVLALVLALGAALAACGERGAAASGAVRLAFVTNGVDPFWDLAARGARDAAAELGVELEVYFPPKALVEEQKSKIEVLLVRGVDGIAISPIDAVNMNDLIDEAAARTHVITHDSDAPGSKRRCFIGCDNYAAGRAVGRLVQEALPEGGSVMLFIGRLEQDNAKKRRQGVIDELLERDPDPTRYDPLGAGPLVGERYTVLDTRTDNFSTQAAKTNAEDALARHADLGCMVGLFAYNPPACLEAVAAAGLLGRVKIVGFDEQRATVEAIVAGHVQGTVSQNPYSYGELSVRVLAALAAGDESLLPAGGTLTVEHSVYRRDNAQELLDLIDRVLGGD